VLLYQSIMSRYEDGSPAQKWAAATGDHPAAIGR